MTPKEIERAGFLIKALARKREIVKDWAISGKDKVTIHPGDEYEISGASSMVLTGDRAAAVLRLISMELKAKIDEIESELIALGVDFEPCELTVGEVVIGGKRYTTATAH